MAPALRLGLSGLTEIQRGVKIKNVVKIKAPLLSLGARGLVGTISYLTRRHTKMCEKSPIPPDQKTLAQLSWRHMYQKAVALWHGLSSAERQEWESQARRRHMTGFAWFMSQALKPNPGLYLPLQGGTMQGDIDMATNRIRSLPFPAAADEPVRLIDYVVYILPYLYHEGARVYHSANQAIPNNTATNLALNSERYDTDSIHDPIINNSRLTCKTAGKYLIVANARFTFSAAGRRQMSIYLNNATLTAAAEWEPSRLVATMMLCATVYDLAINDFLEMRVFQNSGAPLNLEAFPQLSPEFMMQRIG